MTKRIGGESRWAQLGAGGVEQMDQALAHLEVQLNSHRLSVWDRLFLQGQRRELRAARWLVQQMTGAVKGAAQAQATPTWEAAPVWEQAQVWEPNQMVGAELAEVGIPQPESLRSREMALWDDLARRLQGEIYNLTETPLELDILRLERKRELFYLILRQLEQSLEELRRWRSRTLVDEPLQSQQLLEKRSQFLGDLWQQVVVEFFGKYTTVLVHGQPVELVPVLLAEQALVQREMLDKIPFVSDFLAYWILQEPLTIEQQRFAVGSPEALARISLIVQNWVIHLANGVMQPLLNRFGDVVAIKQAFYDRRLLSSREIERFRNNLSWKYRVDRYWREPTEIFESRYQLFALEEDGIVQRSLYAPRNLELEQLRGTRLAVTLLLEMRDAVAPRLKSATALLGSGVVYVLTEVVGRGLGLIGKGILKGIGSALQESREKRL